MTTVATVGYGDAFPLPAAGRGIAVVLMLAGITFFGFVTANIASLFLERTKSDEATANDREAELAQRLRAIELHLETLTRQLDAR